MAKVKPYISSNFTKSFLTIFLPFSLIISLVYLVKIAALTSSIQITFLELFRLYSYSVPDILFYTLSLSFVAALANVLVGLSQDNELIALYSLGLSAKKILRHFLILGLLFSILLSTVSFLAMPLSKQLYKSFKEEKKNEAKLNIVAGKLGQKFANYYIYVKEKKEGLFKDIVIYNRTNINNEQFFAAKTAKLKNNSATTSLLLNDGYGYTYSDDKLQQAKYKTLEVFNNINKKSFKFEDIIAHWRKATTDIGIMHRVLFFTFLSLLPLLSVYLVASFTMINPRYQPNRSFVVIFITSLVLYLTASTLEKWGTPLLLVLSIFIFVGTGKWLFHKRVSKYF